MLSESMSHLQWSVILHNEKKRREFCVLEESSGPQKVEELSLTQSSDSPAATLSLGLWDILGEALIGRVLPDIES